MRRPLRVLVDSMADAGLLNAQMSNAREIIVRLDPSRFQVSVFHAGKPEPRILQRPNTRLLKLPPRRKTARILREFLFGEHRILFYLKSAPASRYYMTLRRGWDSRVTIGTMESQADLRNEPTISAEAVALWEKTVLRCDYLFSNSRCVQQSLQAEYKLASEVVPTGIDCKFFSPAENRETNGRANVLFAGSLRPFKQPNLILDLASRFPAANFALAGDGPMAQDLRARVAREGLSNVTLLGAIDAVAIRDQYRRSDLFVFPSGWEGSPKVILEAAACGLPVVARKNYQPETILDGVSGYLVSSDDEFLRRTEELLQRPELRRQFGEAGRKHSQRFDWDVITRQWEEIFDRLGSAKTRPGA
jgi:glycosyltransferase involved in cell wall biosynthesis